MKNLLYFMKTSIPDIKDSGREDAFRATQSLLQSCQDRVATSEVAAIQVINTASHSARASHNAPAFRKVQDKEFQQ